MSLSSSQIPAANRSYLLLITIINRHSQPVLREFKLTVHPALNELLMHSKPSQLIHPGCGVSIASTATNQILQYVCNIGLYQGPQILYHRKNKQRQEHILTHLNILSQSSFYTPF